MTLRKYQTDLIDDLRKAVKGGHRRILAVSPTGSGKTVLFSHLAKSFLERGKRCIILVHRQELLTQTSATLSRFGVRHGVIAAGVEASPDELIQVCMVQTLARRLGKIPPVSWIICDEAHHMISATYLKVLEAFPGAKALGFSATPARLDGRGLGDVFDAIVEGPSVTWLQNNGHLAPCRYYAPPAPADLAGVHTSGGDYVKSELAAVMSTADAVGDCVKHYQRLRPVRRRWRFAARWTMRALWLNASAPQASPLTPLTAHLTLRTGSAHCRSWRREKSAS